MLEHAVPAVTAVDTLLQPAPVDAWGHRIRSGESLMHRHIPHEDDMAFVASEQCSDALVFTESLQRCWAR